MSYTPTELAHLRALSNALHCWVHDPECDDPDCIEGAYTAEEIAWIVMFAGWVPRQVAPTSGYTAKVGLLRPGTRAWAMSQLGNDVHLTRDEWAEYLDYQAQHLTPKQVESLRWWATDQRRDPDCLRDQIHRSAATLDGLDPELREVMAHRTRAIEAAKKRIASIPASHRAYLEGEFQRAEIEAAAIMRYPHRHCPCTYSTECCHCDGDS